MDKKFSLISGLFLFAVLIFFPSYAKADAPPVPTGLGPANYVDAATGLDTTPTLTFTLPDPGDNSVAYHIQISANSAFSSPIIDYISGIGTAGSKSFTVGQDAGDGSYNYDDFSGILANDSYYWRVAAMNALNGQSAWTTANGGSVAFVVNAMPTGTEWSVVGVPSISDTVTNSISLAFNPVTGEPYAAYSETIVGSSDMAQAVSVKRYNGSAWVYVGAPYISSGSAPLYNEAAYDPSLAFDSAGKPYVSYRFMESEVSSVDVLFFDGIAWQDMSFPDYFSATEESYSESLAIHPVTNRPYVAFGDGENGGTSVMYFNGTAWTYAGNPDIFNSFFQRQASLRFNTSTNMPWVAHYNSSDGGFRVARYDGSDWISVGSTISVAESPFSFAMSPTNEPYLAYADGDDPYKITVKKYDGTNWITVGSPSFSTGPAGEVSLAVNPATSEPYVAYSDGSFSGKVVVMKYNGSAWTSVGTEGFTLANSDSSTSMAFDPDADEPWVAFSDGYTDYGGGGLTIMSHETSGGGGGGGGCGSADGEDFTSQPTVGLCASGNPTSGLEYSWTCAGPGGPDGRCAHWSWSCGATSCSAWDWDSSRIGGNGTNPNGSSYYFNSFNTNLDINATIAIACDPSVTMNPIIGTGKSTINDENQADCTVTTNNSSGYKMEWQASGADMLNTENDPFTAYSPSASGTPETWSIAASTSAWGAKLAATSEGYNGGTGGSGYTYPGTGWGSDDGYTGGKFLNVSSADPFQIMSKATETDVDGETQSILFGAEIGADKLQPTGTYTTQVTITATTL